MIQNNDAKDKQVRILVNDINGLKVNYKFEY